MKLIENYMPIILGIIVGYIFFKYDLISYKDSKEFIKQFTTIGTCSFGFLLTIFSLIIQSDNSVIREIKQRIIPFQRFVLYNKKVVFLSFIFTMYSYIIGYLPIDEKISNPIIIKIILCTFYGTIVWFFIETVYFLILFYLLIQGKKQ